MTVMLATRNRAASLARTLASMLELRAPRGDWKLIVADNGSSDETGGVLARFRDRLPLTTVHEPVPGKNRAIVAALAHASGDLYAFTDDDVRPDPDWLVQLRAAADAQPGFDIFGGRILPEWERPPPRWLQRHSYLGPCFASTGEDWADGPTDPRRVWGPNMAVRARVFAGGLTFDPTIGPSPGQYTMGSETDFTRRAEAAGYCCWHAASAVVHHFVAAHQLAPGWIYGRAFRLGRMLGRFMLEEQTDRPPLLLGMPRYMVRWYLTQLARTCVLRLASPNRYRHARYQLAIVAGQLHQARETYRRRPDGSASNAGD